MSFTYAEYVVGGLQNRNNIVEVGSIKVAQTADTFRSLFLFDKSLKDYVAKTGTVKGFSGKHTSDVLIFDFDGDLLGEVRDEAVRFCGYLETILEVPISYLRLSFSGAKGFHIALPMQAVCQPEPCEKFHEVYTAIATDIAQGFKFIDLSIYEVRRIIRLNNTVNSKSGLFKIPLTFDELRSLNPEAILELAKKPRSVQPLPVSEISEVPSLRELYEKHSKGEKVRTPAVSVENEFTRLLNQGAGKGGRNSAAIQVAGVLIAKGFDLSATTSWLQLWNERNQPPLPDSEIQELAKGAFERYRDKAVKTVEIYNIREASDAYLAFVKQLRQRLVKLGIDGIDKKIRGVMPGETLCILGKTSVGKSAMAQNLAHYHCKNAGSPVLGFSMEMPITSVFERSLQIEMGITGYDVEKRYEHEPETMVVDAEPSFQRLKNFYVVTRGGLNLKAIYDVVKRAEEEIYQEKTGLLWIDYLGLIKEHGDIYEQVSKAARGTKDLAKELNVPIVFLSQVNRKYDEYAELSLDAARDSGAVDEASDFVVGYWKDRDFKSTEHLDDVLHIIAGVIKNRRGGRGVVPLVMEKTSLRVRETTFEPKPPEVAIQQAVVGKEELPF